MAVTASAYAAFIDHLAQKRIDLDTDTIKGALVTSTYTPNQDTHDFFNDITNEIPNGNGYTSGGVTLTGVTWTYNATSNTWTLDANDISWSNLTLAGAGFRYLVLYVETAGAASTDPLIAYVDFGADVPVSAGTLSIAFNASGILTITL